MLTKQFFGRSAGRHSAAVRSALVIVTALMVFAGSIALLNLGAAPAAAAPAEAAEVSPAGTEISLVDQVLSWLPDLGDFLAARSDVRVVTVSEKGVASAGSVQGNNDGQESPGASRAFLQGVMAPTAPPTDTTIIINSDDPDPSVVGEAITVTFTITPNDTSDDNIVGTVDVSDGTGATCSDSVSGDTSSATGSCSLTPTSAGAKTLTATFTPDDTNAFNDDSDDEPHQVDKADTNTSLDSAPNPSDFGETVVFTATVNTVSPSSVPPTGTVTFKEGSDTLGTGTLSTTGSVTATASITVCNLDTGSHRITAEFAENENFNGSTSDPLTQQVGKAGTVTTLETDPVGTSVFGETIVLTATVTATVCADVTATPTGVVFFNDRGVTIGTSAVSTSGVATMTTFSLVAGPHPLTAVYSGDENHKSSNSINSTGTLTHTVERATTQTTIDLDFTTSGTEPVFGQSLPFTVTVTVSETNFTAGAGTPTGNVTIQNVITDTNNNRITTTIGSATLNGDGVATFETDDLEVGPHTIVALYEGDPNFKPSSTDRSFEVRQAQTIVEIVDSTANPSRFGQSVTFTAVVTPVLPGKGVPTGKVFFEVDGTREFTATLGFGNPGEARWGTTPGDDTEISTVPLASPGAGHGNRTIVAVYDGDRHFLGDTSSGFNQRVNKAKTNVRATAPITTIVFGQELTINATIQVEPPGAGTPTREVTFELPPPPGTQTRDIPEGSSSVDLKTKDLPIGQDQVIDVKYGGDDHFLASHPPIEPSEQVTITVERAESELILESSLNPSTFSDSVTFTATVQAAGTGLFAPITPTDTVTFTFGTVPPRVVTRKLHPTQGYTTVVTSTLPAGSHNVTAKYGGNDSFQPSDASITQVVNKIPTTTTLQSSASGNTSEIGEDVTFTVTVTTTATGPVPTGDVTFRDGAGTLGTATLDASGVATITTSTLAGGPHSIKAVYNGTINFASSSSDRIVHTVTAAGTGTTLAQSSATSVFGETVFFTATVTSGGGTPTGDVVFKDGGTTLATVSLDGAGQATLSTSSLAVGSHTITANYSGSPQFASSSDSVNHTVSEADTVVTITSHTPDPSVVGEPVTVQYTVAAASPGNGTPTGNVTVDDGTGANCTGTVSAGQCTLTPTSAGTKTLTATYAGDGNFNGNSGTASHQVNAADTSTSVTSFPNPSLIGQSVNITATVTSEPDSTATPTGGDVEFTSSDTSLNTTVALVNGIATTSHAFPSTGTPTITAQYLGTSDFNGSSGTTIQTVSDQPTDLAVTKTDSPDPVNAGDDLTYIVTVTNNGAESTSVELTDTLPTEVTFKSITATGWTCTTPAVGTSGTITCDLDTNLASGGASASVTIVVNVPLTTPAGTVLVNQAQVQGGRPDDNLSNNTVTQETTVFRSPSLLGDCNGDSTVDGNDIWSIADRIFDPNDAGTASCDANEDARVDAGDAPCTVLIMVNGEATCSPSSTLNAVANSGPALTLSPDVPAPVGARIPIPVPVHFAPNGSDVSSVAFSVDYDETWLDFDPTDGNGDGKPDAVTLNVPGEFDASVEFDSSDRTGEIDIFITDPAAPLATLSEGVIAYVMLDVTASPATTAGAVQFASDPRVSFGNTTGQSVPGSATPTRPSWHQMYLPFVSR